MYESVTVALNGTDPAEEALPTGEAMAQRLGVPLELALVAPPGTGSLDRYEAYLEATAARLSRPASTTVRVGVVAPDPLVDLVAEGTLLCLATKARTAAGEILLGSVAQEVLRLASRPVLLIGPNAGVPADNGDQRTVVCLDGSDLSERGLAVARDWCTAVKGRPWVIEVLDEGPGPANTDLDESSYVARKAKSIGGPAEWEVLHDADPAQAICRFAEALPASTLVLTTHGRGGLRRLAAGSVALAVIRDAPCPVLAFRPDEA